MMDLFTQAISSPGHPPEHLEKRVGEAKKPGPEDQIPSDVGDLDTTPPN
jgi:hypothetical protein